LHISVLVVRGSYLINI